MARLMTLFILHEQRPRAIGDDVGAKAGLRPPCASDLVRRSTFWNDHIDARMLGRDGRRQRERLFFFTVHDKHFGRHRLDRPDISQQIVAIRMGRQTVEADHLRAPRRWHAKDRHHVPALDQFASQRMLGLKANDRDDVGFILDGVLEMMQHPPPSHMPEDAMMTQGPFIAFNRLLSSTDDT